MITRIGRRYQRCVLPRPGAQRCNLMQAVADATFMRAACNMRDVAVSHEWRVADSIAGADALHHERASSACLDNHHPCESKT